MNSYSYFDGPSPTSTALTPVQPQAWLHVKENQSASPYDLEATNKKYRSYFHPLAELPLAIQSAAPLDEKIIRVITHYVSMEFLDSIYAMAPEIVNPEISLQYSLEKENQEAKWNFEIRMAPEPGQDGIVKFIRFERDIRPDRWFALKQPTILKPLEIACLATSHSNIRLNSYKNNVLIASFLQDHPNFMKVFGVVVKKKDTDFTPYLILEFIEGEELQDLVSNQKISAIDGGKIITQFMDALVFLFEKRILPDDVHFGNLLFTQDKQLKFIDFDTWTTCQNPRQLAEKLYLRARIFTKTLATSLKKLPFSPMPELKIPPFTDEEEEIEACFKESLQELSNWFYALANQPFI